MDAATERRVNEVQQLVSTPKDQALPALQTLLDPGQDEETRRLAIQGLSELAKREGDDDQEIRNAVLQAAYDENPDVAKAAEAEYARLNGFDR